MVYLTFFARDSAGANKLFVRVGLGNNWESHLATQINVNSTSAPAIARVDDNNFLIAWSNGGDGISTALLDQRRLGSGDAFRRLGDINDNLATAIVGGPTVSAINNHIVIMWKRSDPDVRKHYVFQTMEFNPVSGNVAAGRSAALDATPSQGEFTGFPQLANDGSRFFLAISFSNSLSNDLTLQRFNYFTSSDGSRWAAFSCAEGNNVVDSQVRPHSIAVDRNGRLTQMLVGNNPTGGELMRACGASGRWRDTSVFGDPGKPILQPAIVFRKGNSP
jgi:hypothetical protein